MPGVKGRSGRKSNANEELRLRVLDKAWLILEKALYDPKIDGEEKREIAKALAVKSIPQHLEGNFKGHFTTSATIQKEIPGESGQNTNRIAEYLLGDPNPPTSA